MSSQKPSKVIVDTNLWISFLIGKELQNLKDIIVTEKIRLVMTDQLVNEIKFVTARIPSLKEIWQVVEILF
ncbi:MAG: putative toxin-antitoxin system toxin component, PIN family [Saprospiraceae bacterium]|nr:putative toxin-antitoxin system toxin component, PIN family [Saprospiraceae bacterium]